MGTDGLAPLGGLRALCDACILTPALCADIHYGLAIDESECLHD